MERIVPTEFWGEGIPRPSLSTALANLRDCRSISLELVEKTARHSVERVGVCPAWPVGLELHPKAQPFRGVISEPASAAEGKIRAGVDLKRGRSNDLAGVHRIREGRGDTSLWGMDSPNADHRIRNDPGLGDRYAQVKPKVEVRKRNTEGLRCPRYSRHTLGAPDTRKIANLAERHERFGQRVNDITAPHNPRLVDPITGAHEAADFGDALANNGYILSEQRQGQ